MSRSRVEAYLRRLDLPSGLPVDAGGLRRLQVAHLLSVPFENLDIHMGVPIVLDQAAFVDKVVSRHRGGFCYELNGAFSALLSALGFATTMLEGRVLDDHGELGIRFDHLCLRVDLDRPYLVDVGFGRSFLAPLRLEPGIEQVDPTGRFTLQERGSGAMDVVRNGGEVLYRFSLEPRRLSDFEPGCRHHQTSPASAFTREPMCTLATAGGKVTIAGSTLIVTEGGRRTETTLDDRQLLVAYREHFGIELDRVSAREG
ncbi:MAG TPA: arylamine N-acetyltransferase [Actinomycetota bacterium]|nr:arylamine N-acetyltransferase [Actinomycetota bacterium]